MPPRGKNFMKKFFLPGILSFSLGALYVPKALSGLDRQALLKTLQAESRTPHPGAKHYNQMLNDIEVLLSSRDTVLPAMEILQNIPPTVRASIHDRLTDIVSSTYPMQKNNWKVKYRHSKEERLSALDTLIYLGPIKSSLYQKLLPVVYKARKGDPVYEKIFQLVDANARLIDGVVMAEFTQARSTKLCIWAFKDRPEIF